MCCTYICFLAASLLHILFIYAARVLHIQYTHIACVLHKQKLVQCHTHATYMHMRSHASEYMYVTRVQLLCAAYMRLFMYSIHAACKELHTHCIHFFICLYGMRVALSQFLCMQHDGCILCAACVQHTCVCAGVHVCGMYAVYMPNMCMKVADIYALCMLYTCLICAAR